MASASTAGTGVFGRYRLLERLGTGGMAQVWRASVDGPEGFSRVCVVKRMLPHLSKDPSFVRMLLDEARLSALLHHPAIVQVHELGEIAGEYFIAMEYVDGHDLASVIRHCAARGTAMPLAIVAYVMTELAAALAYAHRATDVGGKPLGIIHRDVSPSNVMISRQGAVKLLDFGIAKAANEVRDEETRTGALRGKLGYMSPELVDGEKIDQRADIFALGVVFWECLVGRRLFLGRNDFHSIKLVRRAEVAAPSTLRPEIDGELDAVVLRMLARSPADRFQSCDEVVEALLPIARRLSGDAGALRRFLDEMGLPGAGDAAGTPLQAIEPPPRSVAPVPRKRSRVLPVVVALGVAGAVMIVVGLRARVTTPPAVAVAPSAVAVPPPAVAVSPRAVSVAPPAAIAATVHLRVRGPAGGIVFLDGKRTSPLPLDVELPAHTGAHTVEIRAPGYKPWSTHVDGERDATVRATPPPAPHKSRSNPEVPDPFAR